MSDQQQEVSEQEQEEDEEQEEEQEQEDQQEQEEEEGEEEEEEEDQEEAPASEKQESKQQDQPLPQFGLPPIEPPRLVSSILQDLEEMSFNVQGLISTFPSFNPKPTRPTHPSQVLKLPPRREISYRHQGLGKIYQQKEQSPEIQIMKDEELQVDIQQPPVDKILVPRKSGYRMSDESREYLQGLQTESKRFKRWDMVQQQNRFRRQRGSQQEIDKAMRILLKK